LETEDAKGLLEHKEATEELKEKMKTFVESLSKHCWLMIISSPIVSLNFDVVGQKFETIKDRFLEYTPQEKVQSEHGVPIGCVLLVAWPCLQLENESFLTKGEVVIVDETK